MIVARAEDVRLSLRYRPSTKLFSVVDDITRTTLQEMLDFSEAVRLFDEIVRDLRNDYGVHHGT